MRVYCQGFGVSGNCEFLQISCKLVGLELMDLWVWFLFIFQKARGHSTVPSSVLSSLCSSIVSAPSTKRLQTHSFCLMAGPSASLPVGAGSYLISFLELRII